MCVCVCDVVTYLQPTSIFVSRSRTSSDLQELLLCISESGIEVNFNGQRRFLDFSLIVLNDGIWHQIVVTWSTYTGQLDAHSRHLKDASLLTDYQMDYSLPLL